jgi:hypothetical protein
MPIETTTTKDHGKEVVVRVEWVCQHCHARIFMRNEVKGWRYCPWCGASVDTHSVDCSISINSRHGCDCGLS